MKTGAFPHFIFVCVNVFCCMYFVCLHGMLHLSPWTKNRTRTLCIGSTKSSLPDCQGSAMHKNIFKDVHISKTLQIIRLSKYFHQESGIIVGCESRAFWRNILDPFIKYLLFLFLLFREWALVLIVWQSTCGWKSQDITLLLYLPVTGAKKK